MIDDKENTLFELRKIIDNAPSETPGNPLFGVNQCRATQSLTKVRFPLASVLIPIVGMKKIKVEERRFDCHAGDLLIVPHDTAFDVRNIPETGSHQFQGCVVRFDKETLDLFAKIYGSSFDEWDLRPHWAVAAPNAVLAAVTDWLYWCERYNGNQMQTRHRMIELLLLLAQNGLAGNLISKRHKTLRSRLKEMLSLAPARDWKVNEIAARFAMSESTLRRQLRNEDVSFRSLLEEVRLEQGLGLIMDTNAPIGQIALDCGYLSQSRFSERFRLRFSMSPSALRQTREIPSNSPVVVQLNG